MTTGERIRQLRDSRNITQTALADFLNVSPSTIGMYEQNRRKPSFEMLEAIADFFNVSLDYIMCKDDVSKPAVTDEDIKFALFGEDEITDEMYEEVKGFAEYVKQKYRSKKSE